MRRPSAAVVALIVFALVDVGLVWMAVRSTRADATGHASSTVAASAPGGQSTSPSTSAGAAQPSGGSKGSAAPKHGKVIVSALSSTRAWRAVSPTMTCTKGAKKATIGHTDDSGKAWTKVEVPMVTVSGLSFDGGKIIATGLDTSCKPVTYALSSSSDPDKVSSTNVWSVAPTDPSVLQVKDDKAPKQPCDGRILDVAATSESHATVLCKGGSIERSTDGGKSWDGRGTVKDAVAIGTASSGDTVYVVTRADCGLALEHPPEDTGTSGSCVSGTKGLTGPVDATVVGDTLWLAAGDDAVTTPAPGSAEH